MIFCGNKFHKKRNLLIFKVAIAEFQILFFIARWNWWEKGEGVAKIQYPAFFFLSKMIAFGGFIDLLAGLKFDMFDFQPKKYLLLVKKLAKLGNFSFFNQPQKIYTIFHKQISKIDKFHYHNIIKKIMKTFCENCSKLNPRISSLKLFHFWKIGHPTIWSPLAAFSFVGSISKHMKTRCNYQQYAECFFFTSLKDF